jgi:hypothetical protein
VDPLETRPACAGADPPLHPLSTSAAVAMIPMPVEYLDVIVLESLDGSNLMRFS